MVLAEIQEQPAKLARVGTAVLTISAFTLGSGGVWIPRNNVVGTICPCSFFYLLSGKMADTFTILKFLFNESDR